MAKTPLSRREQKKLKNLLSPILFSFFFVENRFCFLTLGMAADLYGAVEREDRKMGNAPAAETARSQRYIYSPCQPRFVSCIACCVFNLLYRAPPSLDVNWLVAESRRGGMSAIFRATLATVAVTIAVLCVVVTNRVCSLLVLPPLHLDALLRRQQHHGVANAQLVSIL